MDSKKEETRVRLNLSGKGGENRDFIDKENHKEEDKEEKVIRERTH